MGERPGVDTETDTRPSARSASLSLSPAEQRLRALARDGALPGLDAETSLALDEHSSSPVASRIGRYTVLRKLGEGGMGVVYACYDEELDRKVAVKLLRSRYQGESAKLRMQREAQGLARLSHPNVVQIYEIGEHHGALFLAMEFVEGKTLRAWVREREASLRAGTQWREILRVLLQAGRGLAAAHAAELIHRDFKPDNVIIGRDGRARVLDFGLVRGVRGDSELTPEPLMTGDPTRGDDEDGGSGSSSRKLLQHTMTREGSVLGTPRYMAPEQLRGLPCDALADQFAFCVVAFEALFGVRPFAGETLVALHVSMSEGVLEPIPKESTVPRAVREAVVCGLAIDPRKRWPRIDALLDALERVLDGRRRWGWGLAVGGVAIAAAVGASAMLAKEAAPLKCAIDESMLAGTWSAEQRTAVREAIGASGVGDADVAASSIEAVLDGWSERWLAGQRDACEATHVRNVQSEARLDQRTACLERQRRRVNAMVGVLREADAQVMAGLSELLAELPDVEACADGLALGGVEPGPVAPEVARALDGAYEDLERVRALLFVGRLGEAETLLASLRDEIDELGHPPIVLEIDALAAGISMRREQLDLGVPQLLSAAHEAEARGLDDLAATILAEQADRFVGNWSEPRLEAWLLEEAQVALRRLGHDDDPREIRIERARGNLELQAGRFDEARQAYEHARALARRHGNEVLADVMGFDVANAWAKLGDLARAEAELMHARERAAATWGTRSLAVADVDAALGLLALDRGDVAVVEQRLQAAEAVYMGVLDESSIRLARVNMGRAKLAMMSGDFVSARALVERALVAFEREGKHAELGQAHNAMGVLQFFLREYEASVGSYRRALEIQERLFGTEHPELALLHANLGESWAAMERHREAVDAYERSLAIFGRVALANEPMRAQPLKGRGKSRLVSGNVEGAIADLEQALVLLERRAEPLELADVRFWLARSLRAAGRELERARMLAEAAQRQYEALGMTEQAEEISIWSRQN